MTPSETPPESPETDMPEPQEHGFFEWFVDNIEAIVVAIILALVIRHFAMEAFVIPTGSMAETLLGAHLDLDCKNCGGQLIVEDGYRRQFGHQGDVLVIEREGKLPLIFTESEIRGDKAYLTDPQTGEEIAVDPEGATRYEDLYVIEPLCWNCNTSRRYVTRTDPEGYAAYSPLRKVWTGVSERVSDTLRPVEVQRPTGGNKILVDKVAYLWRNPTRWEVMVFKYPMTPDKNFIKRCVGLPGETIDIRDGDVWIDGAITHRPVHILQETLHPVYRSSLERLDRDDPWLVRSGVWRVEGSKRVGRPAGKSPARLEFGKKRKLVDWNYYNESNHSGHHPVGDVRVAFTIAPKKGGTYETEILDGKNIIACTLRTDADRVTLRAAGHKLEASHDFKADVPVRVELWNIDNRAWLTIDGTRVLEKDYEANTLVTQVARVSLSARGAVGIFDRIELDRDIYYIDQALAGTSLVEFPYEIPDDQYFVLGDNTSNSTDSRVWGCVPESALVGRAFLIFWPAWPWNWQVDFIR